MDEFLAVLSFLEKYSGKQYKKLDKCTTQEERNFMEAGAQAGKNARLAFTKLVDGIVERHGLEYDKITQWQNSGTFVSYFWCQMKDSERKDSPISLSLFAEKANREFRFRVSVEIIDSKATVEDFEQYRKLLEVPLNENLVYVAGGNNDSEFQVLSERDNNVVKSMGKRKVQVSYIVLENQIFEIENLEQVLGEASDKLMTYYDNLFIEQPTGVNDDNIWWPSLSEYNPGIAKEQWLELLNDGSTFTENAYFSIAAMYDSKGQASCQQLANKYGNTFGFYRSVLGTQLASKVREIYGLDYWVNPKGESKVWPILFQSRNATSSEDGTSIWKIRPELFDALTEYGILKHLKKEEEPKPVSSPQPEGPKEVFTKMKTQEALTSIKNYIFARGFDYPQGLIENFYLSLKSKPFVILAGTSGTGKTRLVKLFAEAIGAKFELVSVRPDWSDGSDLFGHTDLNGNFIEGPVCSAFEAAKKNPDKPVFLCLDEMNLARVEYYLSDFLSVIESREMQNGTVVTEPIAHYENGIPDNLYVIGTVNMDETTFPFSKKVLDRANTIEFNYVDLLPIDRTDAIVESLNMSNDFLRTEYLVLAKDCIVEKELVKKICIELQALNEILRKANAHVGFRVRDEICFYMLNNKKAEELLTYEEAMDNEIMQKILPRIQGSSIAIKKLLIEIFKFCMGTSVGFDSETGNVGEQMQKAAQSAKYKESANKISYMMTRFEDDGFTSYWL